MTAAKRFFVIQPEGRYADVEMQVLAHVGEHVRLGRGPQNRKLARVADSSRAGEARHFHAQAQQLIAGHTADHQREATLAYGEAKLRADAPREPAAGDAEAA